MTSLETVEGEGQHSPRSRALVVLSSRAVAVTVIVLQLVGPPLPPPLVTALQYLIPDQLHWRVSAPSSPPWETPASLLTLVMAMYGM